jgi:hypothetical protein
MSQENSREGLEIEPNQPLGYAPAFGTWLAQMLGQAKMPLNFPVLFSA